MRINTAFILCAGFGKRLNPLTLDTPKPLIKFNNITVLETCINLIESLGIQQIALNTFYLKEQISNFINLKKFKSKITIIEDGENILDTGGGINNMMKHTKEDNILISAHGNSIRALCKYLFKLDENQISKLEIPTGNPLLITLDDNKKITDCKYLDNKRAKDLVVF